MTTPFPVTGLDTTTTLPTESASTPLSTNHVVSHTNLADAVIALETKVGIDGSAVTTTHDYKLSGVTGSDKAVSLAGTEALTNKTLTAPVITSPTLNMGSDAEGDTYYRNSSGALVRLARGTDNYILKMNGNVPNWEAEAVITNATSSAVGIVELATASEITAGTASGSVGPLAITPDQLALSTPVFNGSALTNLQVVSKLSVITTDVSYNTSTATTDLVSVTVPANTLSTNNGIRVKAYISGFQKAVSATYTFGFKYGSTTICNINTPALDATTFGPTAGWIEFILLASGSTSSQEGSAYIRTSTGDATIFNGNGIGTAAIDSTSSQTISINFTSTVSNANNKITMSHATVEIIK